MATTATLLSVPVTGAKTNHLSTSLESTKRKNQESLMSTRKKQPAQSGQSSPTQSTMITEYEMNNEDGEMRTNGSIASRTTSRISIEKSTNQMFLKGESSPLEKESSSLAEISRTFDASNSDSQFQQGKRKLSVSQYKEHKRLKSNEPTDNGSGDIDMRIQYKPPSPPQTNGRQTIDSMTVDQTNQMKTRALDAGVTKKSNLSEPGSKKIVKKKLIWADEKQQELVQTSFFEIDETERMSKRSFVQQFSNPISIAQLEKLEERHFFQQQNHQDSDDRPAQPPLPALIRIHLPSTIPNPVVKSHQRTTQEDRERTVLQALCFGTFIPDSPSEPDFDSTEDRTIETKLIPLEDDSSKQTSDEQPQTTEVPPSIPTELKADLKENPISSLSTSSVNTISPQVAQILAAARGNLAANTTAATQNLNPIVPPTNPILSIGATAQNLFSAILAGNSNVNMPPMNPLANLLSNFSLQFNPLASPLFSAVNQQWTNGLTTVNTQPTPVTQPQQVSPPQTLNPPQNFSNPTNNESQVQRREQNGPNQHNSSKFPNKHFNQRGNPNHRKQHFRRGPANGHRRNFFSDRNTYD